MKNHAYNGFSLSRGSRYYMGREVQNGKVVIIKPADPVKLKELQDRRKAKKVSTKPEIDLSGTLPKNLSKESLKLMSKYIVE